MSLGSLFLLSNHCMKAVGLLTSLHTLYVTFCLPRKQELYLFVPSAPFTLCCIEEAEGARCQGADTLKARVQTKLCASECREGLCLHILKTGSVKEPEPQTPPIAKAAKGRLLPEDSLLTSEDPSLRPQELAHFSRGPAGVDIFLDPVSQVKECHIGGQGKSGLQRDDRCTGLSGHMDCRADVTRQC